MHRIIVGIDPGVVHTGVVGLQFDPEARALVTKDRVFSKAPVQDIADYVRQLDPDSMYIEDYDPRQRFNTDAQMVTAVAQLRQALPEAEVINNAGVATLVTADLMRLLRVWDFSTPTHHQDLRSAARIALFGMLKDKENGERDLLSRVVRGKLAGNPWRVFHD